MNSRTIVLVCAAVIAATLLCVAAPAVIFAGMIPGLCGVPTSPSDGAGVPTHQWDEEQVANAATIVAFGAKMGAPARGWVIAVATAMQESGLRNLGDLGERNDHDSLGLFQQRPSQGWGTPQQLTDPQYATRKFYEKLLTIDGWQSMPLTEAAQAVQRSAYPDAYQRWEPDAMALVQRVASTIPGALSADLEQCLSNCPEAFGMTASGLRNPQPGAVEQDPHEGLFVSGLLKIAGRGIAQELRKGRSAARAAAHELAEPTQRTLYGPSPAATIAADQCAEAPSQSGWTAPVRAPVVSGFHTPDRPTHNGVDLAAPRGTPIRAAASGTVLTVRCNVNPASHGCDRDGSPQISGCGWYVDIQHAGGIITRYCHMGRRPLVEQGQQVIVGQVLGLVGSSGNSSGPHLHYEVHLNHDPSAAGAVDPVPFMRDVGAPLGAGS